MGVGSELGQAGSLASGWKPPVVCLRGYRARHRAHIGSGGLSCCLVQAPQVSWQAFFT